MNHTDVPSRRVLMIASEFRLQRVGGLGSHVAALAPRLANLVSLDLVVPRFDGLGEDEEPLGRWGRVFRVDAQRPQDRYRFDQEVWAMNDQLNAFMRARLLSQYHYDVMHVHDWLAGYVANDLRQKFSIPLVATIHATEYGRQNGFVDSSPLSRRIHEAEYHLVRRADRIIACSEFMRREISHALQIPLQKIVVVPNGVEFEEEGWLQRDDPVLQAWRAQWIGPDDPLIFFVGRMVGDKGPDLLIAAMPELVKHYPGAKAVLAGKGPFSDHLRDLIAQLGMEEHVILAGFISDEDRNRFYAVADVAVFPSRYEPFGIVVLEAMMAGTPVVAAAVGGLQEVVEDGVTGLCVAPGRADALAAGILEVLRHPQKARRRAAVAQQLASERYNWDSIAAQTLAVHEEIWGGVGSNSN